MREVSLAQVVEALLSVGVQAGDGLLVHSALQYLGRPQGGVGIYYAALCAALEGNGSGAGPTAIPEMLSQGTLAVPAFNFGFARGEPYDPQRTPAEGMGAFSEYIRQRPEAQRTTHPMQSLAVIGRHADDLASRDTASAFDPGSAFERMLELDFKLLLLGADIQAVSMLHYSEQRAEVPYRYWKDFSGQVRLPSGWQTRTYRMYVRDLELDPHIELYPVQEALQERGQWSTRALNYGFVSACRLVDFVAALDELLRADPWRLVVNRPPKSLSLRTK